MKFQNIGALMLGACLMATSTAHASETLMLNLNSSQYMYIPRQITRIAVGSPDIIGIVELKPSKNEILVVAKKAGATSMLIWTADGALIEYTVVVSPEDLGSASVIQQAINLPNVIVKQVDNRILLTGKVKNQAEREHAMKVAQLYVGGNILDLLQIEAPTQISFDAIVLEVTADYEKNLGLQGYSTDYFNYETVHNPFKWLVGNHEPIDATLNMLIKNDKAKILSRSSFTTMDDTVAKIRIGGQIPIPNKTGYEYKDYGVTLEITPKVDAGNRITSSVKASVSSIDSANFVDIDGAQIPSFNVREASAVINVEAGMTMAIGGLISSADSKKVSKIDLVSDIPIIGEFFKHVQRTNDKRELIILVTPTIIEIETQAKISDDAKKLIDNDTVAKDVKVDDLPREYWDPPDAIFYGPYYED